jgi:Family of unknown function (DUF6220)
VLKRIHGAAAWLFVAAILVQVFLAGAAIAQLGGSNDFSTHRDFGYGVVGVTALVLVVTAVLARAGREAILICLGLFGLYIVQIFLPNVTGVVAALHPVNALLLFAFAVWYARRAWRASTAVPA